MNNDVSRPTLNRRQLLKSVSAGFGYMAFAGLSSAEKAGYQSPMAPKQPHFTPRAKRVIFLCMRGGPAQQDTFDPKPALQKRHGEKSQFRGGAKLQASPWEFQNHGQGGLEISGLFPNLARHADDICVLRGMHTDLPNHPQAFVQLHTGNFQFVRPSLGAWAVYGLGTENQDLPGFITISAPVRLGGKQNYGSSFLPAFYQGTAIGQERASIKDAKLRNLSNRELSPELQRKQLDLVQAMNRDLLKEQPANPAIEGVIESFELGFRMQSAVPKVMGIEDEPKAIQDMYGIGGKRTDNFGRQCLMARRFAEAGVRFIEIGHSSWDQHRNLKSSLTKNCDETDQPIAALLTDLKQRGMLQDTLVVWGGEFGRTPDGKRDDGRDHNAKGYSMWMAGGGVKGGQAHGATDDFGSEAVDGRVHIHDLHATMLHSLGLDHKKLTYRYAGRDFRLTDVYGRVVNEVFG